MTYFNGVSRTDLGDTGIPFLDSLLNRGKSALNTQIQRVTERVADFKLLPRTHRALRARLSVLAANSGVRQNDALARNVANVTAALSGAEGQWTVTNSTLDSVLSQMDAIRAGKVSAATVATAAGLVSGMGDAFTRAKQVDSATRKIERVVLSPEQQKAALSITEMPNGAQSLSLPTLALLLGGGFLLVKTLKK